MASRPGVPLPIKLQEQHKALFPLDKPINEESGRLVALWASGGQPKASAQVPVSASAGQAPPHVATSASDAGPVKTRAETFAELCERAGVNAIDFLAKAEVRSAEELSDADWTEALSSLNRRIAKRQGAHA